MPSEISQTIIKKFHCRKKEKETCNRFRTTFSTCLFESITMKYIIGVVSCLLSMASAIKVPAKHIIPNQAAEKKDKPRRMLKSEATTESDRGRNQRLENDNYTPVCLGVYDYEEVLKNETGIYQFCGEAPRFETTEYMQLKCTNCELYDYRRRELKSSSSSEDTFCVTAVSQFEIQYQPCEDRFDPYQMFFPIPRWESDNTWYFLNEQFNQWLAITIFSGPRAQTLSLFFQADFDGGGSAIRFAVGDGLFFPFHLARPSPDPEPAA